MMNERLSDIARKPDAPFVSASFDPLGSFGICPTLDVTGGYVETADGKLMEGYKALLTEMERMRRYGFTAGEYERAKSELLSMVERKYNSRDDRTHSSFAQACIDNFRLGDPMPDAAHRDDRPEYHKQDCREPLQADGESCRHGAPA